VTASARDKVRPVEAPSDTSYIVLDDDDRLIHVSPDLRDQLGRWIGHVLWDHMPEASSVYGPCFSEARSTGRTVESVVFYAGRVKRLVAIPAADGLAVHVERLAELDVTNLGTLAESLRQVEAELDARGREQLGRPAPESRQAPP